jgi:mono/diheme cytochrome c family protein
MPFGEKYDAARVRPRLTALAAVSCALLLAACGSEGVSVSSETDVTASRGAEIFATHCAGCHTLGAAGTQGSGNRGLRVQGPNFDQRKESYDEALFAIRNGGFGGAIMPQNIVVGEDATAVAEFLAKYSGSDVEESPRPTSSPASETGESDASPNEVIGTDNQSGGGSTDGGSAPGGSGAGGSGSGAQGQSSDAG